MPASRKGTRWDLILQTLVLYRLIDPGSEWRLHRHWFDHCALADLLGSDFRLAEQHHLYECHDRLLAHKQALFDHLTERWRSLFEAKYEVLLYDLTSTYFESDPPEPPEGLRRFGYSRDKRSDCVQVVIALIVTPEGFPLAYEVLPGNTTDRTTLPDFLDKIEAQYGRANRVWVMDRSKLRQAWRREGRNLLRTNLTDTDPAKLWEFYLQLTEVEQAFKELKGDLAIRPIYHQLDHRIEAHIFVSFLAYALQVTLKARLKRSANGLTPRAVLEKFATLQMLDVHLPTTDGREIILSRHTHPAKDLELLLDQLKLTLPEQPPPRITALPRP